MEEVSSAAHRRARAVVAIGVLVLCCLLWGFSFPGMQLANASVDRQFSDATADRLASRAIFNAVRFGLAAVLYGLITFRRQRAFSRADVTGGIAVGSFFGVAMFLQVLGLRWTLPSVSGFLTASAVVFAPLAQALVLHRRVGGPTWIAVGLAVIGAVLLSWPNPEAATSQTLAAKPPVFLLGEILTIVAAVLFTAQILAVDRFGASADSARLTLIMLATTSVISFAIALGIHPGIFARLDVGALVRDRTFVLTLVILIFFSSVIALHLMNRFQPRVSPATASVVYCTEPIFATMFSIAFGTERWSQLTLLGGLTVVIAVLVVARSERKPGPAMPG